MRHTTAEGKLNFNIASPLVRFGEAGVNQDSRVDEINVICEQ
ncbi:hypothetical protein CLOSTMETH_00343 [[Clostridium] methylpentosum DSM 5476]|uniref:Uncharacterized protein n=1 Tax=[Clostridium] methylpentosum DSM 5476 TaxID=537013 RepID=C0E948_9FIRM|nr:hypothetical protein CLOSTMETH_00343 [[Clostridium] methylpentosum DSM 5476]